MSINSTIFRQRAAMGKPNMPSHQEMGAGHGSTILTASGGMPLPATLEGAPSLVPIREPAPKTRYD